MSMPTGATRLRGVQPGRRTDNGFRNQIQRKGKRNKPLSECQRRRNQRFAKTRARVEHVFGVIEQMGGKLLRPIGQARPNFAMTMMAACYNLKRLVYFQEAGIEAFSRPKWAESPAPEAIRGKKRGNTAGKSGDLPEKLNRIRSRSSLRDGAHRKSRVIRGASLQDVRLKHIL